MRSATAVLVLLIVACGGRSPPVVARPEPGGPQAASVGEMRVLAAPRATGGHVALGLFVQARGASASLRATAALVIEARSGARVRATPDGLTIRTTAEASALEEGLAQLARALAVRNASATEVEEAADRLRRRRAARASDDDALAVRLALEALGAGPLDPFGDLATPLSAAVVSEWLAVTLGCERALVVAVGDVDEPTLHTAVERAFASPPHVGAEDVGPPAWTPGAARTASGEHPVAAVATWTASVDEALRVADWTERLAPDAHASAFPLRGRAVVVATQQGDEAALRTIGAALDHARLLDDEQATPRARDAEQELLSLGEGWLAGPSDPGEAPRVGAALIRVSEEGSLSTEAEAPELDALVTTTPVAPTRLDATRGDATLPNGLILHVARASGEEVAVVLAFRAGAALDPAREHGRAAVLAAVLARSCEPDADVAWVDDATIGVTVRGASGTIERTTLRAVDCARNAINEVAHAEAARASSIAALDVGRRVRGWAATVLAPSAPGWVAPYGMPAGIAATIELEDAMRLSLDARRATLALVADEAPERLLAIGHALGSVLRSSTEPLPEPRVIAEGEDQAFATDPDLETPLGIVALRTDAGASEVGARFVAHALASELSLRGLPVRSFEGVTTTGASFAIVAVTGTDERLDHLDVLAREATSHVVVPAELAHDDASAERERSLALAAPGALARALAAPTSVAPAPTIASALLSARRHLVIVRPTPRPFRHPR